MTCHFAKFQRTDDQSGDSRNSGNPVYQARICAGYGYGYGYGRVTRQCANSPAVSRRRCAGDPVRLR